MSANLEEHWDMTVIKMMAMTSCCLLDLQDITYENTFINVWKLLKNEQMTMVQFISSFISKGIECKETDVCT